VTITPDECVNCRLCEDSCPYGAILTPTPEAESEPRAVGIRRLGLLLALAPLLITGAAALGSGLAVPLSMANRTVRLAEQVRLEELGRTAQTTLDSDAWRQLKEPAGRLYAEAAGVRRTFRHGGSWLGGFMGLIFAGSLIGLSVHRRRTEHGPDSVTCLSCARCFMSCPIEIQRLKKMQSEGV